MIAKDPYLQQYVQEFTEINKGKAFYTSLDGLGDFILKITNEIRKEECASFIFFL
jgi:Ca-activated chloride channel family protein